MRIHWQELKTGLDSDAGDQIAWTDLSEPRTLADAYAGIGVPHGAAWDAVRSAYRARVQSIHPDRAPEDRRDQAEEQMKVLNLCYRMLNDHFTATAAR